LEGGFHLSKNETTPFTFDIKESLSFRAEDQLQDLIGIALEPEINIQEFEHDISVHGVIELTGEYHPVEEVAEGSAVAVSPGTREMENVERQQTGTNTFYHRFPVEISVPKYRIRQLNEVYVAIDQFDYEIPGTNVLELHATVAIYGVTEEQRQPETQAPEQPYYPIPTFEQGEPVQSYTDEIAEQIESEARDNYQAEEQAYSLQAEQTEEVTTEAEQIEAADDVRDEQLSEQQPYNFNQEAYAASSQPEETEQPETQSYFFSQAQYETDTPAEQEVEAEAEAQVELPDESEIEEAYLQQQAIQEAHLQEQAIEEAHAEALRANEAYEELRKQAAYEADHSPSILQEEDVDTAEESEQQPEELYVLPDELEDAFQAADFRQAGPEDDNAYTLDRELPHEEPAEAPDFTFTYQAKQEEDVPPPPAFEAPPVLTSDEDDRWKYKETKTLSEFFGSKTAEPTEVPQANLDEEDIDDNPYTDSYKDVSVQEVPVNQELQPQDLEEEAEEQEAADDRSNSNFLVSMFGAREETFTKVRVCIVQERDTLEKIATRYDVPASSILSSNKLEDEAVAEGQLLVIPQQRRSKKG
jgi:stage VI sporulation protein D